MSGRPCSVISLCSLIAFSKHFRILASVKRGAFSKKVSMTGLKPSTGRTFPNLSLIVVFFAEEFSSCTLQCNRDSPWSRSDPLTTQSLLFSVLPRSLCRWTIVHVFPTNSWHAGYTICSYNIPAGMSLIGSPPAADMLVVVRMYRWMRECDLLFLRNHSEATKGAARKKITSECKSFLASFSGSFGENGEFCNLIVLFRITK